MCGFRKETPKPVYELAYEQLDDAVHLWYHPHIIPLETMMGKVMPGFEMSWSITNITEERELNFLEVEVDNVEGKLETPNFEEPLEEEWGWSEHIFKASLLTDKIAEVMDEESLLLVDLHFDLGDGSAVIGKGGPARSNILPSEHFQFHGFDAEEVDVNGFDWGKSEAECSKSGGHLASIASLDEWEDHIKPLLEGRAYESPFSRVQYFVSLGGSDLVQEGVWQ